MCGIAGAIDLQKNVETDQLHRMLQCIKHRGPDDEGVWFDSGHRVGLGQRRLSIIDLSAGGRQPRVSPDGRFTIVFNGEIYNYQELRIELEAKHYTFKSASDTEVLLYAFIEWKEKCLEKLNGMFAFAVWDGKEEKLFAARDRLGKKPFKYFYHEKRFVFASEIKALLTDPSIPRDIDLQSIDLALTFSYVPAPGTGFQHIHKLPAGHYLWWQGGTLTQKQYWNPLTFTVDNNRSYQDWKNELWPLFVDSVRHRMISDVPLGAFLSGGVDSSSVVKAMTEVSKQPIDTFVVSIGGESEDMRMARIVAKELGTRHHEVSISAADLPDAMQHVAEHYDEPFFDQSAIPSMLISAHMKKHVTVVLSGDGADELFGGYLNHRFIRQLAWYHQLPRFVRNTILPKLLPAHSHGSYQAEILAREFSDAYTEYMALWKRSLPRSQYYLTKSDLYGDAMQGIQAGAAYSHMRAWLEASQNPLESKAMAADFPGRLAEGYLVKLDIASMASGLEVRSPFLDYRLVEKALQMQPKYKVKGAEQKYIWKDIMRAKLPEAVLRSPKRGFAFPLDSILRTSLHSFVESTILPSSARLNAYFKPETIKQLWHDHLAQRADYSNHLWSLIMLELWMRKYQK